MTLVFFIGLPAVGPAAAGRYEALVLPLDVCRGPRSCFSKCRKAGNIAPESTTGETAMRYVIPLLALMLLTAGCDGNKENPSGRAADAAHPDAGGGERPPTQAADAMRQDMDNGEDPLARVIRSAHRDAANAARDQYRHPQETLTLFGIRPQMNVLEISPGRGWYTEILAPYLADQGRLTVASFGDDHPTEYLRNIHIGMVKKFESQPQIYGKVVIDLLQNRQTGKYLDGMPDNSFDMALTFRNTHNWIRFGGIEEVYRALHRVIKPGGVLGVVQHRAAPGNDARQTAEQGYVPERFVITLLEGIGFELTAKSEINANPRDTRDHPKGVWTLPPAYRLGDEDRAKYAAIGESDRMTMKFVKL